MQKTVTEELKTGYFSYSAFWSAGQWGLPGLVTGYCWYLFVLGAVLTYKEIHSFSKSKNKLSQPANRKRCYITS